MLDFSMLANPSNDFPESLEIGIKNMTKMAKEYVDACGSSSRVVLLGYSQGGMAVAEVLGGGLASPPLDPKYTQYITAAVAFGDPTYVANLTFTFGSNSFAITSPYAAGNSTHDGLLSRRYNVASQALLSSYSKKYRSYCTQDDYFCSSGLLNPSVNNDAALQVHYAEVAALGGAAVAFVSGLAGGK